MLEIVHYPHPTLRHVSKPLRRVDADLRAMIGSMFQLMYEAQGIGLAANQVDLPFRFFVCNLAGNPDEGEEHVFINPIVSRPKGQEEHDEGCLSLPGLYAPVKRPATVHLEAYSLEGQPISADLEGLMARVVQHEVDHLNGVLFIDRLAATVEASVQADLEEFELEFQNRRACGQLPDEGAMHARLVELEQQYALLED